MTRVVLDSNVWLSALLFPGGVCDELLQQLRERQIELFVSKEILGEVRGVLRRKFDHSAQEAEAVVREIQLMAQIVDPKTRVSIVTADDPDNRVLECAVEARAELIVTGDTKHLLPLRVFQGISIRAPRTVLDELS